MWSSRIFASFAWLAAVHAFGLFLEAGTTAPVSWRWGVIFVCVFVRLAAGCQFYISGLVSGCLWNIGVNEPTLPIFLVGYPSPIHPGGVELTEITILFTVPAPTRVWLEGMVMAACALCTALALTTCC